MPSPNATRPDRRPRPVVLWTAWAGGLLALVAAAGSIGGPLGPGLALLVTVESVLVSGWPALVYLLAAWGLGSAALRAAYRTFRGSAALRAAYRNSETRYPGKDESRHGVPRYPGKDKTRHGVPWYPKPPVQFAIGLALLFAASHALGSLGLLNPVTAIGLAVVGLISLVSAHRHTRFRIPAPPGWLWVGLPGLALLLTASASPPGALWSSEYGAYDVLSYHLQLPQEWLRAGHTRPLEHNVYSFLPGSIEVAFAHLGWMTLAPTDTSAGSDPARALLAGGGWRLVAAHFLHAGLAILASGLVAGLTRRLAVASGLRRGRAGVASAVAGGLVLCTPWSVVVGSIAYNEMGVLVLGAGAMIAAISGPRRAGLRGGLVGLLVGAACCVKPTALFMVGPAAGVLLLRFLPLRGWGRAAAVGSVAGVLALSPWLVRNAVVAGNPVFPLATGVFGTGHWTGEQADRWREGHSFGGAMADRLRLAVWTDPGAGEDARSVSRHRGMSNPQWLLAFPAGVVAGGVLLAFGGMGRKQRETGEPRHGVPGYPGVIALGLVLGLVVQVSAWLVLTHVQSRFLLPCLLTLAPLVGIAAGFVRTPRGMGAGLGVLVCLVQAGGAWAIFAGERGGRPNAMLVPGVAAMMGEPYSPELGEVSPVAFVNHELPEGARVLLVGGATPLYFKKGVVYATVWDRPPVLDRGSGVGVGFVMIDEGELSRLRGSGMLDPGLTPEFVERLKEGLGFVRAWGGMSLWRVEGEWGVDGLGVWATGSGKWGTDKRDACPTGRSEGGHLEDG